MALTDNLVSYWKLDESSGNAADSVGGNTLTNNGTVTYGAAKINNGSSSGTSTDKWLGIASYLGFSGSKPPFTIACWYSPNSQPATNARNNMWYHLKGASAADGFYNQGAYVDVGGTKKIRFDRMTASLTVNATLTNGVFYYLAFVYDGTDLIIYLDGSSIGSLGDSASTTNVGAAASVFNLHIGRISGEQPGLCKIDEAGVWSRALTSTEITTLYNSGNGLAYPFTTTSIKSWNGLAKTSIKSVNGLAIASVKSINGLV